VLQQCDAPQVLYDHPTNLFVAGFIGSPAMNLFEGSLTADLGIVVLGSQRLALTDEVVAGHPGLKRYVGQELVVGIRPEDLRASSDDRPGAPFVGDVEVVEALGSELLVHFSSDARVIQAEDSNATSGPEGANEENIELSVDCVARIEPRYKVRPGDRFTFLIDPLRFEFFDPASGLAIWE
jgi:multiple sugar transport system ATP-binding protein